MTCDPDQNDIAAADDRMMESCDSDICREHGCCSGSIYLPAFVNESGLCVRFIPFELIDDCDAEDMADLDDPRSLASLEELAA